jgi:hypothetical protein
MVTSPYRITVVKLILSLVGILSSSFLIGIFWSDLYWCGAPIFGTIIVVWHCKSFAEAVTVRNVGFVLCATLIFGLGDWLQRKVYSLPGPQNDHIITLLAVGIGTVLLPMAHALFLKVSWKHITIAVPCIYITWCLFAYLFEFLVEPTSPLTFVVDVAAWQVAYLFFMLRPLQSFKSDRS